MRKAIFGGTFDPIHNGHMNIAYEALYKMKLDKVIFIPSGNPPHKKNNRITDAKIRLDIVANVIKNEDKFEVSDYEVSKKESSYTYKTLEYFKKLEPCTEWYFIIGADSLINFKKWRKPEIILEKCKLIVFGRPGYRLDEFIKSKKYIKAKYNKEVIVLDVPLIDVSSTNIKTKIRKGEEIKYLVPYEAYNEINKLNLYSKGSVEMYNETKMREYIKANLKTERYNHTLGVVEVAEKMAKVYNCNVEKAKIAALLHDCAKNMKNEELIKVTKEKNLIELNEIFIQSPGLLHGFVGAYLAKEMFNVNDEEILDAIRYHTTGRENMTLLEKILYIADYIEPSRCFEGIEEMRELAFSNLNLALLRGYNDTINYVISKGLLLYPKTVEARNYLLINK